MSDDELRRLRAEEKEARERYARMKANFGSTSHVVECARLIWAEASAAVLEHQESRSDLL